MNNIDRESELKHQIARLEQELRHEQERRQLAYQQSLKHDQLGNTKLLARSQSIAGYAVATPSMVRISKKPIWNRGMLTYHVVSSITR